MIDAANHSDNRVQECLLRPVDHWLYVSYVYSILGLETTRFKWIQLSNGTRCKVKIGTHTRVWYTGLNKTALALITSTVANALIGVRIDRVPIAVYWR
jgi:hypothetical protein